MGPKMAVFLGVGCLLIAAAAISYHLSFRETGDMDALRAQAPGALVQLSHGQTYYRLEGPPEGPLLVLLHGGTVPNIAWDRLVPLLNAAGVRTLRFDMFGRGLSDKPAVDYDQTLYSQQLEELLDALGISEPVDLAGYSFGGATLARFAARRPDRVRRILFIAPLVHDFPIPFIVRVPVVGEWFVRVFGIPMVKARSRPMAQLAGDEFARQFDQQMSLPGFERSLIRSLRSNALKEYRDAYTTIAGQCRRVLLIWGTADTDIPASAIQELREIVPDIRFHSIDAVDHRIVVQAPDLVGKLMLDFLQTLAVDSAPDCM